MSLILRRRGDQIAAGDTDQTADIGTADETISNVAGILDPQDIGSEAGDMDIGSFAGTFPAGDLAGSYQATDDTGVGTFELGNDQGAIGQISGELAAQPVGSNTGSMVASSVTEVTDYIDTATATGDWTNPTNAEGVIDGSNAVISVTSAATPQSAAGTLTMNFGLPAQPAGTRGDVELRVRHRIDTTVALVSDALAELHFEKSTGADSLQLINSVRASTSPVGDNDVRDNTSQADEFFDVTSHVSSWSEAELSTARLRAVFDATVVVAGGDAEWEIDAIAMSREYTQTGIT